MSVSSWVASVVEAVPKRIAGRAAVDGSSRGARSAVKVAAAHLMEGWAHRRGREPGLPAADVEMGEHWFFIDSSKAERLLSFSPRDPMETLAETISYVRERFLPREARA